MPEGPESSRLVFVYGTLRRGECNDVARYSPVPVFVGSGEAQGVLHDLGPYPGAVFEVEGDARVVGEVYRIAPAVELQLDHLEGVQPDGEGEYRRRDIRVHVGAQQLMCLAYQIHPARVPGARRIESGDWLNRQKGVGPTDQVFFMMRN